jgi:GT2 family glycosyltransferase
MAGDLTGAVRRTTPTDLSIVVLAWDDLQHTRAFVESVRAHTDVSYKLIVIDNGSQPRRHAAHGRRRSSRVGCDDAVVGHRQTPIGDPFPERVVVGGAQPLFTSNHRIVCWTA